MIWQLQTAKQRFSEVVDRALSEGPQVVTRRGREVVVILSVAEYRHLRKRQPDFKRFLREAPDFELLGLDRTDELARRVEL